MVLAFVKLSVIYFNRRESTNELQIEFQIFKMCWIREPPFPRGMSREKDTRVHNHVPNTDAEVEVELCQTQRETMFLSV